MQIHFNDAYELLTSVSDYLKRMLQHEAAGSVMGLHAERMSEEEILLLEEEVLPAIGRFIERAEAIWEAPGAAAGPAGTAPAGGGLRVAGGRRCKEKQGQSFAELWEQLHRANEKAARERAELYRNLDDGDRDRER
jgi:hypothetical protein